MEVLEEAQYETERKNYKWATENVRPERTEYEHISKDSVSNNKGENWGRTGASGRADAWNFKYENKMESAQRP